MADRDVGVSFAGTSHGGTMVPVFACGPGAAAFAGIYENAAVFARLRAAPGL